MGPFRYVSTRSWPFKGALLGLAEIRIFLTWKKSVAHNTQATRRHILSCWLNIIVILRIEVDTPKLCFYNTHACNEF